MKRIHEAGLLVVINQFLAAFTQQNLAVANLTDGMVVEPGFAAGTSALGLALAMALVPVIRTI
jgi:hypothetical protein